MKTIHSVIFSLFVVITVIYKIDCQICTKHEVFTTQVRIIRTYQYWSEKECNEHDYLGCGKAIKKIGYDPSTITKRLVRNVKYCCDGYVRNDSSVNNESIICQPLCVPNCVNGTCVRPGQCICYDGYIKDPTNQHKCKPTCIAGCEYGSCNAPNNCECNPGYQNINGTCRPICSEPCHNGICVGPDICDCLSGYRKSENNTCEPYCYTGCEHGSCVAPETCSCDEGWFLTENARCASFCGQDCSDRKCVPQYSCECSLGYELNENNVCKPKCKNCEGVCVSPYNCECDLPFLASHSTADDSPCDCFTNCTDEDVECEKTTCLEAEIPLPTIIDDEATDETPVYIEFTDANVVLNINRSVEQSEVKTSRFDFDWTIITLVFGLIILLIILGYVVISKWKYLLIYFKGGSYIVEDVRDVYQSSQFVNVPLSDKTVKEFSSKGTSKEYCISTT